jgi:hypothetical protein
VTHHASVQNILNQLQKLDFRIVVVHLVDAHHCSDAAKFISIAMLCLSTMMRLGFAHINVLSKVDLVEKFGPLAYNLDFYTEVQDLAYLIDHVEDWRVEDNASAKGAEGAKGGAEGGGRAEDAPSDVAALSDVAEPPSGMSHHFRNKYRRLNEAMCELGTVHPPGAYSFTNSHFVSLPSPPSFAPPSPTCTPPFDHLPPPPPSLRPLLSPPLRPLPSPQLRISASSVSPL